MDVHVVACCREAKMQRDSSLPVRVTVCLCVWRAACDKFQVAVSVCVCVIRMPVPVNWLEALRLDTACHAAIHLVTRCCRWLRLITAPEVIQPQPSLDEWARDIE